MLLFIGHGMLINRKNLYLLLFISIFINLIGVFQPIIRNDDPALYAGIAKHIVISNDWVGLYSYGHPWLDKPHFPFWASALSFELFGINAFAYNIAGFIFFLIGGVYTYKLAKLLYNQDVGLISCLIYFTSFHLMTSGSVDVRAEAYLLGQIIPACYYWLLYDRSSNINVRHLFLGALFTALAIMTKGIFVVLTIFSGLVITWLYTKKIQRLISGKWIVAYILSLIFILPELICLYLQFDLHPELTVFGRHNVSGLEWFFWGSQFGRFFNTGPIVNTHGDIFFFIHTYLWAFLPWSIVFILSMVMIIRQRKIQPKSEKAKNVYLMASFWLTFIIFSLTKFQLDHYTNIIMPFAAIVCARYLEQTLSVAKLALVQKVIAYLLLILAIAVSLYLYNFSLLSLYAVIPFGVLCYIWFRGNQFTYLEQLLFFPVVAILSVFIFVLTVNWNVCRAYDSGYNLAQIINNNNSSLPVYDFDSGMLPLDFYVKSNLYKISQENQLPHKGNYYVVLSEKNWLDEKYTYLTISNYSEVAKFCGNTIDKVIPYYANKKELTQHLNCFMILQHEK